MIKINRYHNKKIVETFQVSKGSTLLKSLSSQGYPLEAPCNGQGSCGKCRVKILRGNDKQWHREELDTFTKEELEMGWRLACLYVPKIDVDFTWEENKTWNAKDDTFVFLKTETAPQGVLHPEKKPLENLGIAIDIGTTTVVASLVSVKTGQVLSEAYAINPQKQFGLDVMSRIAHQEQAENVTNELKSHICTCLDELVANLSISVRGRIAEITIVGNTPMLHFLMGLSTSKLGKAPYHSLIEGALLTDTLHIGIKAIPQCPVYLLPPIKAFVGSDISAGMLAADLMKRPGNVLLIDIGTNGELVLKTEKGTYCCSCAAGPAFEGANISCGMRACAGAIESIELTELGTIETKTIGDSPVQGICGSGVLDAISILAKHQWIGKTGRLKQPQEVESNFSNHFSEDEKGRYFIPDINSPTIRLYQSDIRQIQLAKGAIRSGIEALLNHQEILKEDISEVLIAGQFGTHIKESSLIDSGMLPNHFKNKVIYIGNSAKQGAELCLCQKDAKETVNRIAEQTQYIELSLLQGYDRLFVQCLNFR